WFASAGATKKTRASAVVTRTSEPTASAGRGMRRRRATAWIVAAAGLLGDDILERRPADHGEEKVVEREEAEVAPGRGRDARADCSDDDRHGERQEEKRQEQIPRASDDGHRAEERPDAADPEVGKEHGRHRRAADRVEEERVQRQRHDLGGNEK